MSYLHEIYVQVFSVLQGYVHHPPFCWIMKLACATDAHSQLIPDPQSVYNLHMVLISLQMSWLTLLSKVWPNTHGNSGGMEDV